MNHTHKADVNIRIDIPTQDLESLVEKITDATVTVIGVWTACYILKRLF